LRLLLDQNLAHELADLLPGHDVKHAKHLGWDRLENGALLTAAEDAGFEVMITADKNLRYQQSMTGRKISVLVLSTNRWPTIREASERILAGLEGMAQGQLREVTFERPRLSRRRPPGPTL
jgi:predicted nuclease of predicted toxin-antitoxin system